MVDYDRLRRLLTSERLGSYLGASGDDLEAAFALYEWNIAAAAAAVSLTAMVEVVIRNALDAQMSAWARSRGLQDWFDAAPLDGRGRNDVVKARQRARRGGRIATHGRVVAELNLGFWRFLVSRRYLTSLWVPRLSRAFPHAPGTAHEQRQLVENDLQQLLYLRNRAAHHEPIHRRDLAADLKRSALLVGYVDPVAHDWVLARQTLSEVLAHRPQSLS